MECVGFAEKMNGFVDDEVYDKLAFLVEGSCLGQRESCSEPTNIASRI